MKNAFFIEDWLEEKLNEGLERGEIIGLKRGQEIGVREGEQIGILKRQMRQYQPSFDPSFQPRGAYFTKT